MELEGTPHIEDTWIYAYTDRPPTRRERQQREKEPLTVKQKILFRAMRDYVENNGKGPTKAEVQRLAGHRSATTTKGFLRILDRKNWIILSEGNNRIELI